MNTVVENQTKGICHGGQSHGQTTITRRIMAHHRTHFAPTKALFQGRKTADQQPGCLNGDSFCAQNRNSVGISSPGNGLWLRDDLLAATSRLATSRDMGQNAPYFTQQTSPRRPDRFFPCGGGFSFCSSGFWGAKTGPNPTDRRKLGSKHHILTDAEGTPLTVKTTGANRHDVTQLLPLVDGIPPIAGKPGRPRQKPDCVQGDRGYDSEPHRQALRQKGIKPILAKRRTEHGSGLGVFRWVVERTLSWLHQFRRLRVRYERRSDIHEAFVKIGCILICHNVLQNRFC
jgi:transposase